MPGRFIDSLAGCLLLRVLRIRVVLLVVDILRSRVLFLVDLALLARRQLLAVCRTVCLHLLVDAPLLILKLRRFAGRNWPLLTLCAIRSC